ncbi:MAG: hypothetical protein WCD18_16665 [Thermosynechococcaceae cyanobacterium]
MSASILRQLWSVIEETQTHRLLKLSDSDLVKQLLAQFQIHHPLSGEETQEIQVYLANRLSLIRDMAQA